jgi:hypothetical protein
VIDALGKGPAEIGRGKGKALHAVPAAEQARSLVLFQLVTRLWITLNGIQTIL